MSGENSAHIQQINFQAQSEIRNEFEDRSVQTTGYENISQYVNYNPDDIQESDSHYYSTHDFYTLFNFNIIHNLV